MSAIAIDLLERLRKSGIADEHARQIAEAFDARVEESLREAKRHAEQVSERAADKAEVKFATKQDVSARETQFVRREENESKFDLLRAEMKAMRAEMTKELQYLRWGMMLILLIIMTDVVGKFLA